MGVIKIEDEQTPWNTPETKRMPDYVWITRKLLIDLKTRLNWLDVDEFDAEIQAYLDSQENY